MIFFFCRELSSSHAPTMNSHSLTFSHIHSAVQVLRVFAASQNYLAAWAVFEFAVMFFLGPITGTKHGEGVIVPSFIMMNLLLYKCVRACVLRSPDPPSPEQHYQLAESHFAPHSGLDLSAGHVCLVSASSSLIGNPRRVLPSYTLWAEFLGDFAISIFLAWGIALCVWCVPPWRLARVQVRAWAQDGCCILDSTTVGIGARISGARLCKLTAAQLSVVADVGQDPARGAQLSFICLVVMTVIFASFCLRKIEPI